jgi:hypothetical protein
MPQTSTWSTFAGRVIKQGNVMLRNLADVFYEASMYTCSVWCDGFYKYPIGTDDKRGYEVGSWATVRHGAVSSELVELLALGFVVSSCQLYTKCHRTASHERGIYS